MSATESAMEYAENIDRLIECACRSGRSPRQTTPFRLVVLGSGMAEVLPSERFDLRLPIGPSRVAGHPRHAGVFRSGEGRAIVLAGRRHLYEGDSQGEPNRHFLDRFLEAGPMELLLLSAAGGLAPGLAAGELMVHSDWLSPVPYRGLTAVGRHARESGDHVARSTVLRSELLRNAPQSNLRLKAGTYAWVSGPSYETRAEIRMLRSLGADAVGMSVYHEIAAAGRRNVPIVGLSVISNVLSDTGRHRLDHAEVTAASANAAAEIGTLLRWWVGRPVSVNEQES